MIDHKRQLKIKNNIFCCVTYNLFRRLGVITDSDRISALAQVSTAQVQ